MQHLAVVPFPAAVAVWIGVDELPRELDQAALGKRPERPPIPRPQCPDLINRQAFVAQ